MGLQHRLMIQWETDIVCEDDVSVIVRCDRPDDFNKTIEWSFETKDLLTTLEQSQHPGERLSGAGMLLLIQDKKKKKIELTSPPKKVWFRCSK